jgi:hypothetical protein
MDKRLNTYRQVQHSWDFEDVIVDVIDFLRENVVQIIFL